MKKAFTLIELLIVIAIIGILSSIVVVSLGDQTDNAKDARAKFQAAQIKTEAVLYFNENSDYNDFCDESDVTKLLDLTDDGDADDAGDADCNDADSGYAAFFPLENPKDSDNEYWCVDSTGETTEFDSNNPPSSTVLDCS